MGLYLLLLIIGIVALVAAGRFVSRALVTIAHVLGVSEFVIAFFLLAFSTTIPEFFVGISAALAGAPTLSLGDVIGSNIINLTLIAGSVILIGRKDIPIAGEITRKQGLWIFGVGSLPVFLIFDGVLSRYDGILLLVIFFVYLTRLAKEKRLVLGAVGGEMTEGIGKSPNMFARIKFFGNSEDGKRFMGAILVFALGVALLIIGAKLVVDSAQRIAVLLGVSQFIIGLFLIAFGTSVPELAFGIRAAFAKSPETSIGDVLGAVALNSSWVLGVVALLHPIVPAALGMTVFSGIFMIAVFAAFFFLMNRGGVLYPREGLALIILYILFFAGMLVFGNATAPLAQ